MTKLLALSSVAFTVPLAVFASGPYVSFHLFPPIAQLIMGSALVILAIIASVYAMKVAKLFGGALGKCWTMLAWASLCFAILQIVLTLAEYGIAELDGIDDISEIFVGVFLFLAFYQAYKVLKGQTSAK